MRTSILGVAAALALFGIVSQPAQADIIDLNFEGINNTYPSGYAFVGAFYNGGLSSDGTSGTNYGIDFSANAQAICLNTLGTSCSNTSRGGIGDPTSDRGALFFLSGGSTFMNVAAGFTTGFSFNSVNINFGGSVTVYDGLNGTGNVLGTLTLAPTTSGCPAGYQAGFCPFFPNGIAFAGTALSVGFAGVADQVVFDDVTFGSTTPGVTSGVPEPSTWALMLAGFAGIGFVAYRRKKKSAVVAAAA